MSHSWHDDPVSKWTKRVEVVSQFRQIHFGKDPTFWLDKVCIEQTRIADGLRALPVCVMACRKVLVLCGNTYPSRLWCVWELFTLVAFAREGCVYDRMQVAAFGKDHGHATVKQLRDFCVMQAHCYDPNEETKLKAVIRAVGEGSFNAIVRHIAGIVERSLEQPSTALRSYATPPLRLGAPLVDLVEEPDIGLESDARSNLHCKVSFLDSAAVDPPQGLDIGGVELLFASCGTEQTLSNRIVELSLGERKAALSPDVTPPLRLGAPVGRVMDEPDIELVSEPSLSETIVQMASPSVHSGLVDTSQGFGISASTSLVASSTTEQTSPNGHSHSNGSVFCGSC